MKLGSLIVFNMQRPVTKSNSMQAWFMKLGLFCHIIWNCEQRLLSCKKEVRIAVGCTELRMCCSKPYWIKINFWVFLLQKAEHSLQATKLVENRWIQSQVDCCSISIEFSFVFAACLAMIQSTYTTLWCFSNTADFTCLIEFEVSKFLKAHEDISSKSRKAQLHTEIANRTSILVWSFAHLNCLDVWFSFSSDSSLPRLLVDDILQGRRRLDF